MPSDTRGPTHHDGTRRSCRSLPYDSAAQKTTPAGDLPEDVRLEFRLAVAGGSETAFDRLADDELGNVYERNGSYYTVVVTNSEAVDRLPATAIRGWLMGAGVVLLFGVGLLLFDRVRGEPDGRFWSSWNR